MSKVYFYYLPAPILSGLQVADLIHYFSCAFLTSLSPRSYKKEVKNAEINESKGGGKLWGVLEGDRNIRGCHV